MKIKYEISKWKTKMRRGKKRKTTTERKKIYKASKAKQWTYGREKKMQRKKKRKKMSKRSNKNIYIYLRTFANGRKKASRINENLFSNIKRLRIWRCNKHFTYVKKRKKSEKKVYIVILRDIFCKTGTKEISRKRFCHEICTLGLTAFAR